MPRYEYNGKGNKRNYYGKYNRLNNTVVREDSVPSYFPDFAAAPFKKSGLSQGAQHCFNCPTLNYDSCSKCSSKNSSYPSIGGGNNCISPPHKWDFAKNHAPRALDGTIRGIRR